MRYTHVFSTHAPLQEYLVEAIIRAEAIDPEGVLVLRVRGSFRAGDDRPYVVLDGGRYENRSGRNVLRHRRENQRRFELFKAEVLDQLTPDFQVYGPMYTYWYLNLLADRARAYHVLEDGFGSYQTREEVSRHFAKLEVRSWKKLIAVLKRRAISLPEQRARTGRDIGLLDGVGRYYSTSRFCFPWADPGQLVVLQDIFPPRYDGRYAGATVMATSCLVEAGLMPRAAYLELLRVVTGKIAARGTGLLYFKLHPTQARNADNAARYRAAITAAAGGMVVEELPQETIIESLAAGNKITFVTGLSTLGFHVAATGAEVLTYLDEIEALNPGIDLGLAKGGEEIFRRITKPL